MNIENLLNMMWLDYTKMTPNAQKIVDLLEQKQEKVVNDHIALRTFNHPKTTIDVIARPFVEAGYVEKGDYHFEEKKLYAKHYEHPNQELPKVFISELLLEKFSTEFNDIVNKVVSEIPQEKIDSMDFTVSGRSWNLATKEYETLKSESDYGAWLSAIGYRPNHFTIFINALKNFETVEELNEFLKDNGFKLNNSGGEVKGSKEVCLEQSSTLADNIEVEFSDKKLVIPSCYFEFAKRYPLEDGNLYQGFVAKSADKIFESTNKGQ